MGVSSCSFKGLWSTGQRCRSRSICTFLVEREQLLVLKSQRLCDLLRFNLVYNIRMKLTEALWVIPGNLVFISFSACHCQYVPSCLGLAPRPIGISTMSISQWPTAKKVFTIEPTSPSLHWYYWSWKHSVSQEYTSDVFPENKKCLSQNTVGR